MFDILIKNGTIIDGSGKKSFKADIGIEGGFIAEIGELTNFSARKIIDASGLTVCPGFIDILNRSDSFGMIFENPSQESILRQGVTTIIGGNCGSSLAPIISTEAINAIQKWADIKNITVNWSTMAEFLENMSSRKNLGVNFGSLVGHTTLRRGIIGKEIRSLERKEQDQLNYVTDSSMREGAFGISAGLVYSHTKITPTEELIEVARVVSKNGGYFSLHLRNEGENIISAVNEAIRISQEAGVSLEIAHFKIMGEKNWPIFSKAISMIEAANRNGAQINFDVFPYLFSAVVLYTVLPDWTIKEGKQKMLELLRDPEQRKSIIFDMQKEQRFDYGGIIIAMSAGDRSNIGSSIGDIAKKQGLSAEEMVLNLILENRGRMIGFACDLSEDNLKNEIANSFSLIASNAAGYNLSYAENKELAHPRCFGAFPRAIKQYALDQKIVPIEEMIAKMTSRPAKKIGLKNRGEIRVKNYADIAILNMGKIKDNATINFPYQYSEGIEYVIINGQMAVEEGRFNGLLNGKILKKYY